MLSMKCSCSFCYWMHNKLWLDAGKDSLVWLDVDYNSFREIYTSLEITEVLPQLACFNKPSLQAGSTMTTRRSSVFLPIF